MQSFFEELDQQLGDERGPSGEPSSYDFQSHELFGIVERPTWLNSASTGCNG